MKPSDDTKLKNYIHPLRGSQDLFSPSLVRGGCFILRGAVMESDGELKDLLSKRDRWNLKYYWALRDYDEDAEVLARKMCQEIDRKIDEISKLHYGVSI